MSTVKPVTCGICGEIFTPPNNRVVKYCPKCREKYYYEIKHSMLSKKSEVNKDRKIFTLTCVVCGEEFQAEKAQTKYCPKCMDITRHLRMAYRAYCRSYGCLPVSTAEFNQYVPILMTEDLPESGKGRGEAIHDVIMRERRKSNQTNVDRIVEMLGKASSEGLSYGRYVMAHTSVCKCRYCGRTYYTEGGPKDICPECADLYRNFDSA